MLMAVVANPYRTAKHCCISQVPGPPAEAAPRAGDVLLFAFRRHLPACHCAIATGDGAMIHAHDGAVVTEVTLTGWWLRHLTGMFRFPESRSDPLHEDPVATVSLTPKTSMTLRTVS
jgi:cell wall-associated NlpC family hydrolase